jgi:hypothetical protein
VYRGYVLFKDTKVSLGGKKTLKKKIFYFFNNSIDYPLMMMMMMMVAYMVDLGCGFRKIQTNKNRKPQ